jgi:hypothetical protein
METKPFSKSWFSPIVYYSTVVWTIFCFVGTWFVILKYGLLIEGLFAVVMTFFFAAAAWAIPLMGLVLLSLYVDPQEEPPPYVPFEDLIRRGMRKSLTRQG